MRSAFYKFCVVLLLLFFSNSINAQYKDFGDISAADFDKYDQSYDSTSAAVVLFDVANVWFDREYNCFMDRHTRIKILNESGVDYGDVEIVFNKDSDQYIKDIKANSFVLNSTGVERSTLNKKDIYEEKVLKDIYIKKFTMPRVSSGTVIEYSYQKKMGNPFNMPDWKFHKEIPVAYSEIDMKIPWRFQYMMIFKGVDSTYTSNSKEYKDNRGGGYIVNLSKKDMPPVEELPFMNNRNDFISEVYTQMDFIFRDDGTRINYFKTWDDVADEIRDNKSIGRQKLNRAIKRKVSELTGGVDSPKEKAEKIFHYVAESMVWNNMHRVYSEKGIRNTFKDQAGSSGDINLLLYKMLQASGVEVNYGFTSTRSNGSVMPEFPIINQFNNIVAVVEIDGKAYVLDATEGKRSFLLPPVKNLYQLVFVVKNKSTGWYDTKPLQNTISNISLDYELDESGKAKANFSRASGGYEAQKRREQSREDEVAAAKVLMDELSALQIDTASIKGIEEMEGNVIENVEFSFDVFEGDSLQEVNYLNPMLFLAHSENPFKRATRDFPVYFPFPMREYAVVRIKIPEGFEVAELPSSSQNSLPENKGLFNFFTTSDSSSVTIVSDLHLAEMAFHVEEYEGLQNLFKKLNESHSAPIVIKRIRE